MDKLFLMILGMSMASLSIILAAMLIRLLFKNAPKKIRLILWAMAAFRLLCPVSIESTLNLAPQRQEILPVSIAVAPELMPPAALSQTAADTAAGGIELMDILPALWLAGLGIMLIYALLSFIRLRRKSLISLRLEDNIYLCDHIDWAFILGLFRPRICIPSETEENELGFIIAHERAHLKALDHIWKALGYSVLALHWFNPAVWLGYVLFCCDLELCCDERVIKSMGTAEKKAYSQALLISSLPHRNILDCPLAFAELGIRERIKAVLNYRKPGFWIAAAACIVTAVLFVTELSEDKQAVIDADMQTQLAQELKAARAETEGQKMAENAQKLPLPGEGGASQLIEQGESFIRVSCMGQGEASYTVLSAELGENVGGMEKCLLLKFSVKNENVPESFYSENTALANCFNISDGSLWSSRDRLVIEPEYLDIAKEEPGIYFGL